VRLPLLPSSPLSIHILPRPAELSRAFPFIIDAFGHTNTNISISSCDNPTNKRRNIRPLNLATIRGPHRADHIRRRYRRWARLRHIQPEHQLHHSGRTGSVQPRGTEKYHFLGGTARGSNAVLSNRSSVNGNSHRRNGAMDAKEGNVRTALSHAVLVGFAARFLLKRTDHDHSSFFVAFRV